MTDFAGLLIAVGKDKIKFLSIVVSGSDIVRKSYGAAIVACFGGKSESQRPK